MTFAFVLLTIGVVLVDSGWTKRTIAQVINREAPPATTATPTDTTTTPHGTPHTPATPPGKASHRVPGHPELRPGIAQVVNQVRAQFPGLVITSTISGTHADHSLHFLGRACDLGGSDSLMLQAASWCAANLTHTLTEGIHKPNLSVKNGQSVPPSFWGEPTWGEHANHIHLGV